MISNVCQYCSIIYYSVVIVVNLYCNLNDKEDIMVWYVIELSRSLYMLNFSDWNALNIRSNLIRHRLMNILFSLFLKLKTISINNFRFFVLKQMWVIKIL